jgi:NADH-quinone oxidoreductase subunit M
LLILIGLGFTLTSSVVTLVITFELLLLVSIFLLRLTAKSERAVEAALEMFVWTLVGSAAFLAALVSVTLSGQMPTLGAAYITQPLPTLALALLCLGFGVKLPIWPCFSWLLKAHVEASVEFSILLSGIVVKFGALGLYRILSLQSDGVVGLILVGCCTIAMLEATLRLLAQRDLKRIVALTTVIEINWVGVCLGLGGPQLERVAAFVIVAHSITTTAEFFMVECIYRRYQTRDLLHIAGLATQAPALYALSFVNVLTTLGFPGTSLFAAKVLFLTAIAQTSLTLLVGFALLLVFALPVIFMRIWLPVWFGQATTVPMAADLSAREATVLTLCMMISVSLGFYPALLPL